MAKITWTSEAQQWLKDIYDYIAQDNPAAANDVIGGIFTKAQILSDFPEIGYQYAHESGKDIRILLFGHYRIAYLRDAGGDIRVLGVFHGALEIEHYLL